MKVLWLTNEPLPELAEALSIQRKPGSGWITALAQELSHDSRVELGVASRILLNLDEKYSISNIQHFTVHAPQKKYDLLRPTVRMIRRYQEIITDFSPDVIHIHGAEWYGGFITIGNQFHIPTIISIQGLINPYYRYFFGGLSFLEILKTRTLRDWLLFRGLWEGKAHWKQKTLIECDIMQKHSFFIGRTLWDRAHLRQINPEAKYFHCDEMVQKEFYNKKWDISEINRHTIFAPSARYPLKGFHLLIKAVVILKKEFPDIIVRVPLAEFTTRTGFERIYVSVRKDGYSNYLTGLIKQLGLSKNIIPLGILSNNEMAEELRKSHVFSLNSYVENSPNSLAEALTIGVPSVVSMAGGVPSLIDDEKNVLGFPLDDEIVLAEQIRRVFLDDDLAVRLSIEGQKTARKKYSSVKIVEQMINIYQSIIKDHQSVDLE